jgi:hypothetical protein
MGLPENIQQMFIREPGGVEIDLKDFAVVPEIMVGRISFGPSGIADAGPNHALDGPKLGIGSPESPQGESGGFDPVWHRGVDGGE